MRKPKLAAEAASHETELAGLVTTRDNLQARQTAIAAELEQAVARRREALIQGSDAAAIAEAERACRDIEGTAAGVADALAEVERRIVATEQRIAAERQTAEIETVAAGLERNATEIQKAGDRLAKALAEVAKAHTGLAITISGAAAGQFDPVNGPAGPVAIASNMLLHGLVQAMPGLEIRAELKPWSTYSAPSQIEGADPIRIAAEFSERLRETAGKVRAREIGPELPIGEDYVEPVPFDLAEMQIYVISPFSYHRRANAPTMVASPVTLVPWPVAERAIELGVAASSETPEWRRARQTDAGSADATTTPHGWGNVVDIEFDLAAWLIDQRAAA